MFVRSSRFETARLDALKWQYAYQELITKWNRLVERVNAHGGEALFQRKQITCQLSQDEIKRLLILVHPDKHAGKRSAVEMTQRLLELRDK